MSPLRILLVDDHTLIRDGLRLLIQGQPDMRIVGEANNGREALQLARERLPDVVVMDLSMPGMNGLEATEKLLSEHPRIRVLILTAHEDQSYFRQMCQARVTGYVLKKSAAEELVDCIRKVAAGHVHFDRDLASAALAGQGGRGHTVLGAEPSSQLSPREEEILRGTAWGHSNKELAALLGISVKTVETHKMRISEKLGFKSRADMVRFAVRAGWLNESRPAGRLWAGGGA